MKPGWPPRLFGWTVPSGSVGWLGTPSGSACVLAGMLNAIQCSTSSTRLRGAVSGSCMMSVKLCVAAGAFSQDNAGETGEGEAWVYLSGMTAPSVKDVLVNVMGGGGAAVCAWASAL